MKKPDPKSFLSSIMEDTTSIRGRVATLSFQNQTSSSVVDWVILALDHCQCITLFILANFKIYGDQGSDKVHIIRPLLSICRLFSPANLLTFDQKAVHAVAVVILLLLATIVLRIMILIYIIVVAYKGKNPNKPILLIWQWIFKTQARVIYFCIASIWVNILEAAIKNTMKLSHGQNNLLIVLSCVMFALEFIFSFILQTQFPNVVPSKSPLSAKDCTVETLTLVQKFSNQLIRRVLSSYPKPLVWIYCVLAFLFSLVKLRHILKYLPVYNLNGLFYQLLGTIIVLCLNFACLCQPILKKFPMNMDFVVFLWIILSLLFGFLAANHLKQRFLSLIFNDKGETPEALVHKIIVIKHILKETHRTTDLTLKNKWELLASSTLYQNFSKAFHCLEDSAFENLSTLNDKKARNRLFVNYLQKLLVLYPKSHYLHLYTAWFYASKPKLYGLCLKMITELKHVTSWEIKVGTTMLLYGVKNKLIHDYQTKNFMFNLSEYVQSTSWLAKLKLKIAEQVQLQVDVCQEMNQPSVDLNKISQLGGQIIKTKAQVEVYRKKLSDLLPDYFAEPLVVLAQYYLIVHHSFEKYLHYWNNYINKTQKYEKIWASGTFCEENLYNKDSGLIVFSADEERAGKIVYCGGVTEKIFGKDIKGQHLSTVVPSILQFKSGAFIKLLLSDGDVPFVNSLVNRYFYNLNGYMTRVTYYMNLNPYAAQSLTYYMIVQPVKTSQETILINEDGGIECFTKNIGKELNLFSSVSAKGEKCISMICSELVKINHAFNMILDPTNFASGTNEKKQSPLNSQSINFKKQSVYSQTGKNLTMEEAQEIYQLYSVEGRTLIFQAIDDDHVESQYLYKCTVAGIVSNNHVIKFIYLDKIFNENSPTKRKYSQEGGTFSEISETQRFQDEKDQGWIDLAKLVSDPYPQNTTYPTLISPPESTARGLLSLRTTHQDEKHTQNYESPRKKQQYSHPTISNNEEFQTYSKSLSHNKFKQDFKIEGLTALRITRAKRFEKAINSRYYPFMYRVTISMLYILTILLFTLELALSIRIRSGYRNLELAKEVLLHAEARNNYAMDLNVEMVLFLGQASGLFTFSEMAYGLTTEFLQAYVKTNLGYLQNANLRLLATADSLEKSETSLLFEKDILLSDLDFRSTLQIGTNVTTFQATTRIVQTVLKAIDIVVTDPSRAISYLRFCVRNIMNDFLIKGQTIADNFQGSFQEKKSDLIKAISYYMGGVLLYIGIFILGFSHVIYKQYQSEVTNLMAFSKISKVAIKNSQSKLADFQSLLYQNMNFENLIHHQKNNFEPMKTQVAYPLKSRSQFSQPNVTSTSTDSQRQSLVYRNLKKGYYLTLLQSSLLGLLVISMAIGYREFFAKSFRELGTQVDQLYYIERLNGRISLTRNSLFELVVLNDTLRVLNKKTSRAILDEIDQIAVMQNTLPDVFPMNELPANSMISQVLYKDACGSLKDDIIAYSFCTKLSNYQENVGLVNMISNLEALFNDLYDKYEASDLSVSSLHDLQVYCFQEILSPIASSVQPLITVLSSNLNDLFAKTSDKGSTMNDVFISINSIVIVLVCFVLHYFVISKLKRKENDFKQILGIFPANIVLSNFILKSYLMKTSKENFDSIHEDMMQ